VFSFHLAEQLSIFCALVAFSPRIAPSELPAAHPTRTQVPNHPPTPVLPCVANNGAPCQRIFRKGRRGSSRRELAQSSEIIQAQGKKLTFQQRAKLRQLPWFDDASRILAATSNRFGRSTSRCASFRRRILPRQRQQSCISLPENGRPSASLYLHEMPAAVITTSYQLLRASLLRTQGPAARDHPQSPRSLPQPYQLTRTLQNPAATIRSIASASATMPCIEAVRVPPSA